MKRKTAANDAAIDDLTTLFAWFLRRWLLQTPSGPRRTAQHAVAAFAKFYKQLRLK